MAGASNKFRRAWLLVAACAAVAGSTFFLSDEPGRLTFLSLLIQLLPILPLEFIAGTNSANAAYDKLGWMLTLALNVLAFLTIAAPLYFFLRRRAASVLLVYLAAWLALYLLLLFVLFPVTHLDL